MEEYPPSAERVRPEFFPSLRLIVESRQLEFYQPIATSRGPLAHMHIYIIHCEHAYGYGRGEVCPMPYYSPEYSEHFLSDVLEACAFVEAQGGLLPSDFAHQSSLRFGMEAALLSSLYRPIWPKAAPVTKHHLIWMADREGILKQIEQGVAQGACCLKLKVGALPWAEELALLKETHQLYPHIEIRTDANGALSPHEAPAQLEELAACGVQSIEQPIAAGQWDAMSKLIQNAPLTIALDEELLLCHSKAERHQLLERLAPPRLIIKPSLHGGLIAAEEYLELSQESGSDCIINSSLESPLGLDILRQWCAYFLPHAIHGLGTGKIYKTSIL